MRLFLTEKSFRRHVEREAETVVRTRIAERISLYITNPKFLRAATAAFYGVELKHAPEDFPATSGWVARAIKAFGEELAGKEPVPAFIVKDFEVDDEELMRPGSIVRRDEPWPAGSAFAG